MRIEKPLPDAVYRELWELKSEVEELEADWDSEDAADMGPRIRRVRQRLNDLTIAAEAAKDRKDPT